MHRVTLAAALICWAASSALAGEFTLEKSDDGVAVMLDGKLFTKYVKRFQNKPILHPIIGPTGKEMTRPLGEGDHPHHSSLWFTHGDVNGADIWHKGGLIEHQELLTAEGGETGLLKTKSAWHDKQGDVVGHEVRTMTFAADETSRTIDVDITFTAEKEVTFGKTKEGSFGVRVWPTMTVKQGGTILNSDGQQNGDAWGKPAAWVDYFGQIEGETLGIAILNHPSSLRHPTTWHVRTYGLFAANPFMKEALKLQPGDSFTLRHRVIFHTGSTGDANVAEAYKRYAARK